MTQSILIATRESRLAQWQAEHVRRLLIERFGLEPFHINLDEINTFGRNVIDSNHGH
jgi:porphobilinogen deaminase